MALMKTPVCNFEDPAKPFSLPGVDGKIWTLDECKGDKGLLVMFICNHCPYVKVIRERLVETVKKLQQNQIGCVAIMSNDTNEYPEDSFENMQELAKEYGFTFPYLLDKSQEVAKSYGAICTPDFFGYNADLKLQYRGRLDSAGKNAFTRNDTEDLMEAMLTIADTGIGPREQIPSMGCSIKWQNK